MTYRELAQRILEMNEEQLNSDITVYDNNGEYFRSTLEFSNKNCDTLDEGHPVISVINANCTFLSGQYTID
jgi:hypothetical protein